jgi:CubicO group peptidase (beta-lactamase class C family)
VREHIFQPIGMRNSFTSRGDARANGLASGHRYWFSAPIGADLPYPEALVSAGYVMSTAEDMARYLAMMQNDGRAGANTILSPAGMSELLRPAPKRAVPRSRMQWAGRSRKTATCASTGTPAARSISAPR